MSGPWSGVVDAMANAAAAQERQRERDEQREVIQRASVEAQRVLPVNENTWDDMDRRIAKLVSQGMTYREALKQQLFRAGMEVGALDAYVLVEQFMKDGRTRWFFQAKEDAEPPLPERERVATLATATLAPETAAESQNTRSKLLLQFYRYLNVADGALVTPEELVEGFLAAQL